MLGYNNSKFIIGWLQKSHSDICAFKSNWWAAHWWIRQNETIKGPLLDALSRWFIMWGLFSTGSTVNLAVLHASNHRSAVITVIKCSVYSPSASLRGNTVIKCSVYSSSALLRENTEIKCSVYSPSALLRENTVIKCAVYSPSALMREYSNQVFSIFPQCTTEREYRN